MPPCVQRRETEKQKHLHRNAPKNMFFLQNARFLSGKKRRGRTELFPHLQTPTCRTGIFICPPACLLLAVPKPKILILFFFFSFWFLLVSFVAFDSTFFLCLAHYLPTNNLRATRQPVQRAATPCAHRSRHPASAHSAPTRPIEADNRPERGGPSENPVWHRVREDAWNPDWIVGSKQGPASR